MDSIDIILRELSFAQRKKSLASQIKERTDSVNLSEVDIRIEADSMLKEAHLSSIELYQALTRIHRNAISFRDSD